MPGAAPITVLLGRFDDLVARGLRTYVEEDPALALVAGDVAPEALGERLAALTPRVAVVDFGRLRSPADVHHVCAAHPATDVVVLADGPSAAQAHQVLTFGATACLSTRVPAPEVLDAIHLAARGMVVLPRADGAAHGPAVLTPRESAVLDLLREDRSNAQIARSLCVGIETVRTHRRNIYRKLGVRTRRELAALTAPVHAER